MSKQEFLEQNLKAGEVYSGLILGKDGAPDHHVFLLPTKTPTETVTWQAALDWAKSVGGDLPTRNEQSLLFANAKEHFDPRWYWSNTPYADHPDYAWIQGFGNGHQTGYRKSTEYRARAVRRLIIQ